MNETKFFKLINKMCLVLCLLQIAILIQLIRENNAPNIVLIIIQFIVDAIIVKEYFNLRKGKKHD